MAAIEPSQPRSATVVALETVVAVQIGSAAFVEIGHHGKIWLSIARDLSRRLYERNKLIPAPNQSPRLFIVNASFQASPFFTYSEVPYIGPVIFWP